MKRIISALSILVIFSCTKEKETVTESENPDTVAVSQDSTEIVQDSTNIVTAKKLDKFGFPPEVEGCSCYFAENKADFQNEKFVYVDDYGNSAYIKVNGKLIKIPMEEGDFDPANFNKTIENGDYQIKMTGKKISEMDEIMMFEGNMTVENLKTGETITTSIYGECGC